MWHEGPAFLKTSQYPEEVQTPDVDDESETVLMSTVVETHLLEAAVKRCGTWKKLKGTVMQCLLFSYRCRKETKLPDYSSMSRRAETILLRYLSTICISR